MPTQGTDNYESLGFDKFLTRKSLPFVKTVLEDESSLQVDKFGGSVEGIVKFVRLGLSSDRPIQGERAGAIYYETDNKKLYLWDGASWVSVTLS